MVADSNSHSTWFVPQPRGLPNALSRLRNHTKCAAPPAGAPVRPAAKQGLSMWFGTNTRATHCAFVARLAVRNGHLLYRPLKAAA